VKIGTWWVKGLDAEPHEEVGMVGIARAAVPRDCLRIELTDGRAEVFVVNRLERVVERLRSVCGTPPNRAPATSDTGSIEALARTLVEQALRFDGSNDIGVFASRAQPGDYVQWVPLPDGSVVVEIANTQANEQRPLSEALLVTISRLGFELAEPNFQRLFPRPGSSPAEIARVIAVALADVFGVTERRQLDVTC
jgi:hypothetical protein